MALDHVKRKNRRPIECRFCNENQHFHVTHSRGNTLHRGGYGYVLSSAPLEDNIAATEVEDALIKDPVMKSETKKVGTTHHYLFIEEALFLFEQGLLHAYRDIDVTTGEARTMPNEILVSSQPARAAEEPLSRYELFQLLKFAGVSLPSYLVYQHLRAQTYRVVRHTPTRLAILVQQVAIQNQVESLKRPENPTDKPMDESISVKPVHNTGSSEVDRPMIAEESTPVHHRPLQSLKRQLRCDTRQALPPEPGATIAWDGYHPSASFSAASPGLPDFYVAITFMTNDDSDKHSTFSYRDVQSLLHQTIIPRAATNEKEEVSGNTNVDELHIPLKIATVSDSGTVLLFGITDFGVPMNHPPPPHDAAPRNG
jgi:hypothetical protein